MLEYTSDLMINYSYIFTSLLVIFLCVITFKLYSLKRRIDRQERIITNICKDVSALCKGAEGADTYISSIDLRLRKLSSRQEVSDSHFNNEESYSKAIKLVKRGASASEIVDICDVNESEAKLLLMMHGGVQVDDQGRIIKHVA